MYASDAKTLSVRACFPQLVELETNYGSLVRGMLLDRSNKGELCDLEYWLLAM